MIDVICSVQGQKKYHQGPPKLALHLKNCISKQLAKKLLMSVQLSSASGQKVKAISVKNKSKSIFLQSNTLYMTRF